MSIPNYQQWLQETGLSVFKPRSSRLKAVDEAILRYQNSRNEKDLWSVRNAFEDWKRQHGPMWETSERNRKKTLTRLNFELQRLADSRNYQVTHFTFQELNALAYAAKERKKVLAGIFADKQVTWKAARLKDALTAAGKKVVSTSKEAQQFVAGKAKGAAVQPAGPPAADMVRHKVEEMVKSFFGVSGLEELGSLGGFILSLLGQFSVSVPPLVGSIKNGYDLFTGWAKVGADLYARHNISDRSYAIETGVPAQAFQALQRCLAEETKNQAVSATTATAAFALRTGLTFVDGGAISGPVVGAVTALADFAHALYLLAVEWRATQAVNRALQSGELDIRLFQDYPLMGCYLLVSATLSDLIPVECFGTPGWMDAVENLKRQAFDRIYSSAADLIEKSPWEIQGLPKRPQGTSCGAFAEARRLFSTVSPLAGLKELGALVM